MTTLAEIVSGGSGDMAAAIARSIRSTAIGVEYDDLYSEACLWLWVYRADETALRYTKARRRVIDYMRRVVGRKGKQHDLRETPLPLLKYDRPMREVQTRWADHRVRLSRLKGKARRAFLLYGAGYTLEEIGHRFGGVTLQGAKYHLDKARRIYARD